MPAADIPVSSDRASWTTPATWQELAPTSLRIGNFVIRGQDGAKAEAAIFSFKGSVGTELDNVNRWRNELKLPPLALDKIVSEPVTVDSVAGRLYEISGGSGRIVAASLPRNGDTWVFKMWGDKDVVADAEPVFRDFLKTVHFIMAASPPANTQDPRNEPKWTAPANWTETKPGAMVFKSFSVGNEQGKTASVNISFFQGETGGIFANVNRWRGQMSLPPIEEGKLDEVAKPLDTTDSGSALVDLTGTDARTGGPARLIAAIVPHGDNTWFYKLSGDTLVVAAEKESFVKFVRTVHYP